VLSIAASWLGRHLLSWRALLARTDTSERSAAMP